MGNQNLKKKIPEDAKKEKIQDVPKKINHINNINDEGGIDLIINNK